MPKNDRSLPANPGRDARPIAWLAAGTVAWMLGATILQMTINRLHVRAVAKDAIERAYAQGYVRGARQRMSQTTSGMPARLRVVGPNEAV